MKLLFLMPEAYPSFRPDITALFGKYLPQQGIGSDIVGYRASQNSDVPAWGGGEALLGPAPVGRMRSMPGRILHFIKTLLRSNRTSHGAIQVRDMPILGALALLRARLGGQRFIYWMSFPVPEMELRMSREQRGRGASWLKVGMLALRSRVGHLLLYRVTLPFADHIFVQSDAMLEDMARRGVARNRMTAVPMGVDLGAFPSQPAWAPAADEPFTMAYLGTCEKARRIDFLFSVLQNLRAGGRDVRLLLVGDAWLPVEQTWLRDEARRLGVADAVTITGWLPAAEARRRLLEAHLAISIVPPDPLLDVASPTKLVEYLALGMPVVANHHPDQDDVLAASGAGITAPFEAKAFADAVALMQDDRVAAASMAAKGPDYVRMHRNYASIASRIAEIYRAQQVPRPRYAFAPPRTEV